MKRKILFAATLIAAGAAGFATGQSTQTSDSERLKQTAQDFGTTPAGLLKFMSRELGEPLLVADDGALHVGVHRDENRNVTGVQISTRERNVLFNLRPSTTQPAMRYTGGLRDGVNESFSVTTDFDGDARVDQIILRHLNPLRTTVLLRLSERFEPATSLGNGRFVFPSDDKVRRFDLAAREWVEDADQSRNE